MSNIRTGSMGTYIGSFSDESEALSTEEMQINATYIYKYFSSLGWTVNAISGMLGNMQAESTLNPGRWQGDNIGVGPAYGLTQWDPFSKYTMWCAEYDLGDPSEMDNNLKRIIYELENNIQYYATDDYNLSFSEFSTSTLSAEYLSWAFAWNYERSYTVLYGTPEEKEALKQTRGAFASAWYNFLTSGDIPTPGPNPNTPSKLNKKGYNFLLFTARRRRNQI